MCYVQRMRHLILVTLLAVAIGTQLYGRAPDLAWPQFRGPAGAGVLEAGKLPITWSAKYNVAWRIDVEGRGWS